MTDGDASSPAVGDGIGGSRRWRPSAETLRRLGREFMAWRQENGYRVGDALGKLGDAARKLHESDRAAKFRGSEIGKKVAAQFEEGGAGKKFATFVAEKSKWDKHYVRPSGSEQQPRPKWPGRAMAGAAAAGLFGYAVHRRNQRREEAALEALQQEQVAEAAYRAQAADQRLATAGAGRGGQGFRL